MAVGSRTRLLLLAALFFVGMQLVLMGIMRNTSPEHRSRQTMQQGELGCKNEAARRAWELAGLCSLCGSRLGRQTPGTREWRAPSADGARRFRV